MDKKNIRKATKVILNATDNEMSALEKSFLLVASIEKELSRGCIHRSLKGELLATTEEILKAMLTDGKVLLQVPRTAVTGRLGLPSAESASAGTSSSSATSIGAGTSSSSATKDISTSAGTSSSSATSISASSSTTSIGARAVPAPNAQEPIFIKKEPIMNNQNQDNDSKRKRLLIARKKFIEGVLSKTDDPIRIKDMNKALEIVKKDMNGLNDI